MPIVELSRILYSPTLNSGSDRHSADDATFVTFVDLLQFSSFSNIPCTVTRTCFTGSLWKFNIYIYRERERERERERGGEREREGEIEIESE